MSSIDNAGIQRIFNALPGLFLILRPDADFTIVAASPDFLRATYADPAIYGQPFFKVFPDTPSQAEPAELAGTPSVRASLARVLATGLADDMPARRYEVKRPVSMGGGVEEHYWTTVNSPILSGQGEVEFIVHRIEEAAAKTSRNAIEILDSITEGFFTLDRSWRFDYVNAEAHRILDRTPGDLSGQVIWEAYPGLEGTDFERAYHSAMFERNKSSFTGFYPNHGVWYEVTTFPAPEGISVYFRNVTSRKALEAEREQLIVESERQRLIYETALDNTPDFVYVFDVEHRAVYANGALLKTWGVDDVRGKRWMELGYEQWHADLHDRELDRVISTRAPIRGEIPFTGTNGRRVYDYIFAPVFGPGGEVVAVAGTTRDITERQAAEQAIREQASRLAEADRIKDEFLATLSHELRNPLAPLRNSIALLRRAENEHTAPINATMERQVNLLVRLVGDLLESSRISRGTLSLQKARVELAGAVRASVEASHAQIEAAGHALVVELSDAPLWVEADPVRISQILSNLLDNAAKYTACGGRIRVRARSDGTHALVSVSDNGNGMAADTLPRMFEMFSRGDRDTTSSQGGLGIGLALSRRLAELHGGTLEAHSEGAGKGSEFTLRIPLGKADETVVDAVHTAEKTSLARSRVMVVDDNADAGDTTGAVLELLGADVHVVRGGREALDAFAAYAPTVVLLDIGMPEMNGYEVARAIRGRFPQPPVTLVALTGWGQADDRRRAREAGFDHHLVKPADIDALQGLLASLDAAEQAP